jgi:hypothetical protein
MHLRFLAERVHEPPDGDGENEHEDEPGQQHRNTSLCC